MATVHQVAVITNSCVKSPVNPSTGLSATENERSNGVFDSNWYGKDADYKDNDRNASKFQMTRSVNFDTMNTMGMDALNADLSQMSDDNFYQRLVELKNEHKRTLALCEHLYNDKLVEQRMAAAPARPVPVASVDNSYVMSVPQPAKNSSYNPNQSAEILRHSFSSMPQDGVRDMTATKPPSGRPRKSAGTPERSFSTKKGRQAWTDKSVDEDYWKTISGNSSDADFSDDETRKIMRSVNQNRSGQKNLNNSRNGALSKIDDMWDNFSVEDYAPRSQRIRPRSSSLSRISRTSSVKDEKDSATKEWRHRLTIPKPFSMTLRESTEKTPKKTTAMVELELERMERELREEEECQKKFKATPVPAHVYMPLFDEIMEEKEARRRYVQEKLSQLVKSRQKPFKFDVRESEKKKFQRSHSMPVSDDNKKPNTQFKANPFPAHIFDDSISDRISEEEEYRKIRMQMRAEELLKSSSLPGNMKSKGREYTEGKSRQKIYAQRAKKAGITSEHKFKPHVNDTVPDFEQLHREFMTDMSDRKYQKEATVCKPFKLHAATSTRRHKVYEDIARDEERLRDNQWSFRNSKSRPLGKSLIGSLSSSMDSLPTKMTTSAELRTSANKARLQKEIELDIAALEAERRRRLKEKQLKKHIVEKAAANDQTPSLKDYTKAKIREYKDSERSRKEEYRRQLNEITQRVQDRPLLFERTAQTNARQTAERKYQATLRKAGLDEDFVNRKGSSAGYSEPDESRQPSRWSDSEDDSYIHSKSRPQSASHSASQSARSASSKKYSDDFEEDEVDDPRPSSYRSQDRTAEDGSEIEEDVEDYDTN